MYICVLKIKLCLHKIYKFLRKEIFFSILILKRKTNAIVPIIKIGELHNVDLLGYRYVTKFQFFRINLNYRKRAAFLSVFSS